MTKGRLEAFSDGVLAIILTIMVLEMKVPHPHEGAEGAAPMLADLKPVLPIFLSYVLSFGYIGIYWNNHHHMLHATRKISGGVLWANLHLLFWLSLIPFTTGWTGENRFAAAPTALYGAVLLMSAIAFFILQTTILRVNGRDSVLARAIGSDLKGKGSVVVYAVAIPLAFLSPLAANGLYILMALVWLIPDRRIEHALEADETARPR